MREPLQIVCPLPLLISITRTECSFKSIHHLSIYGDTLLSKEGLYFQRGFCAGESHAVYLVAAETSAAAPLAKPSTESLSRRMVVEVSSVSLMPLGLELWGVQAAVSCCTCEKTKMIQQVGGT